MKRDAFWLWLLAVLLLAGMAATLWLGRGKTRHGLGVLPPVGVENGQCRG